MKNYNIASLSNGFQNRLELQNVYNNNYKNRMQINNQNRMMSSYDLNKNKGNNIQMNSISNRNFNPYQTQYDNFYKKRERNASLGNNNIINYHLPRGGSQYNLNDLRKMNSKYERENLNLIKDNRFIQLPENNTYYNSGSDFNNKFKTNKRHNNINTSPNENMNMNVYDNNEENEDENINDEDIDNIVNDINDYNNNNSTNNLIKENKALKIQIKEITKEKKIIESKANEIIQANEDLSNENKILTQKVNQLSKIINSYRNSNKINNKEIIQKYEKENALLKANYNNLLKQQKNIQNIQNNPMNKNSNNNIKEINYYKNEINKMKEQLKKNQENLNQKEIIIKDLNKK